MDMFAPEVGDGFSENNHEGYTGKGFFNFENSAYSTATYNVTSDQSASNARVMIRYSFQGNTDRNMNITIDNGTYDVTFKSTGSWDKWDTVYIEDVWVDALDFKVKLASATADGGPNIDMIAFDIKGVYRTGCKPAKVAIDSVPPVRIAPVREMQLQPKVGKSFNALGRELPASTKARKYPAIRTFNR
jgi:hypothetical protein